MDIEGLSNTILYNEYSYDGLNFPMLLALIGLVIVSGFFSMTETAISSVSQFRLKMHVEDGVKGSKHALYVTQDYEKTISTILVLSNLANIAIATIAVGFVTGIIPNSGNIEVISVIGSTLAVLIFGEVIPKTLGKNYSETIILKVGKIMYFIIIILTPIVWIFLKMQRIFTPKETKPEVDEDELEIILDTMEEEGTIKSEDVRLIKSVFDIHERSVEDIMTHRMNIMAIDVNSTNENIKNILIENKYSRVPVYKEDKDHIVGIVYEKEFLAAYIQDPNFKLTDILKKVKYVNKNMKVDALIQELQKTKTHIAIVSGEYGDTLGLVTMEDCLEELVGEIYDEHDEGTNDTKLINQTNDNTYLVDGEAYVEHLFDELGITPPDTNQTKLNSWIFEESQELPEAGYIMNYKASYTEKDEDDEYVDYKKNIKFEITKVDTRRILEVLVTVEDTE